MTQKKMEERFEANEREMAAMKEDLRKIPAIQEGLEEFRQAIATLASEVAQLRHPKPSGVTDGSVQKRKELPDAGENSGTSSEGGNKSQPESGEDNNSDRHKFKKVEVWG